MQTTSFEPRRSWTQPKYRNLEVSHEEYNYDLCASCGSVQEIEADYDVVFCQECVDWSKQSLMDHHYDDLGTAG